MSFYHVSRIKVLVLKLQHLSKSVKNLLSHLSKYYF